MALTAPERETIVNMNDDEEVAYIYTAQRSVITRLKKNPAAKLTEEGSHEGSVWARFEMPAKLVSFRSVKVKPVLSEEERAKRRARLANNVARKA